METAYNITPNNYKQPTEIRKFMVQGIIDAFLHGHENVFHPTSQSVYRVATLWLCKDWKAPFFSEHTLGYGRKEEDYLGKIRGCEMKEAFRVLQENGYYIFKVYEYGSWLGYYVSEKPVVTEFKGATRVTEFNDFID